MSSNDSNHSPTPNHNDNDLEADIQEIDGGVIKSNSKDAVDPPNDDSKDISHAPNGVSTDVELSGSLGMLYLFGNVNS